MNFFKKEKPKLNEIKITQVQDCLGKSYWIWYLNNEEKGYSYSLSDLVLELISENIT